ncbi:helix-hairpin-helix domain-containing protein [Umezawaea endophytica]|uniref:ComEA family DNA-binding protein n=1 Tax=Umezawaea endophytica TaxID=1654476 RepID=A0A9X2VHL5_9PSEU|nr:ComEA family DNA-binding protein [Umezawaea endophytica]MCS7476289.1 ComEA family DNA-binding protein [Umezawaea endophytica]
MFDHRTTSETSRTRLEALAAKASADPSPKTVVFTSSDGVADPPPRFRWARRKADRLVERWLPDAAPPRKRRALYASVAATTGLAVLVAVWWQAPTPEAPPDLPVAVAAVTSNPPAPLVVNVVGEVPTPGLVTVPSGARVADAITAAGGVNPGIRPLGVNLARKVVDGEQVSVGTAPPPAAAEPSPDEKLDLNTATKDQLDGLPGVGPVTAQRILDRRTKRGPFTSLDQLREIEGIGDNRLVKLRELVRL